jgi:Ca2+/Na+ antiporter
VNQAANLIGVLFGVAIIAVLAAKPQVVSNFFNGLSGVTRAAVSPVTGH